MLTILPDYLFRRFVQGKRIGQEITFFSVWFELRWGITLCLLLTVSLITTVFYLHPSTMAANSVFRTVTILTEDIGRVAEVYVGVNQRVTAGEPLFRLDSSRQEAELKTAEARVAQLRASEVRGRADLARAEADIARAQASLRQAQDEYDTRAELFELNPDAVAERDVETALVDVKAEQASLIAARAARDAVKAQLEAEIPAQIATAEGELQRAQTMVDRTLIKASTDGILQQFALRPGDIVNPMLRPAGILVPDARVVGLVAGFSQIEARVIKPGMIGEVACIAKPWEIVPMVVTEVQDVVAGGQIRATDQLIGIEQVAKPGSITVLLEPLYEGALDDLPRGSNCIANLYTSFHEDMQAPGVGGLQSFGLHALGSIGLVHALILRIQATLMPFKVLVFSGGH
ncbi:MAG: biotin/lipoyl-binding protein [Woeseiaceae bacterium]|nr:biotin/lipoyl-binding protein [Woeseiaceae bacterium]